MIRHAVAALTILAGGPALAQAPFCGGISLVGEWVGGDEAGSDASLADAAFEGTGRVPIAGHSVQMFTLSEAAATRIDVRAVPSGDPYVTLFDAEGTAVAEDDDSLGGLGSRIEAELQPGTYCLAIRSYEPGVTDVAFAIGRADATFGPDFPGAPPADLLPPPSAGDAPGCFEADTPSLGEALDAAAVAEGTSGVAIVEDAPAYGFTLAEPMALTVTATSVMGDPLIRILDADFLVLAENDDDEGLDSRIELSDPLPAGDYCIEVEDLNGGGNEITVALSSFDPTADRARRLSQAEFAPTAADGVEIAELGALTTTLLEEVEMREGARWFAFDLPEGGLVITEAIGDGADPIVTLFDRAGRRLGENDDGPDGFDSLLVSKLAPGRYTLAVRLAGTGYGSGAVRVLMERYVPAE